MNNEPVGKIIREIRPLSPQDPISRAAEAIRATGLTEFPVVNAGRVVGIISESSILDEISSGDAIEIASRSVSTLMRDDIVSVNPYMFINQVAEIMNEHDIQTLPAVDEYGRYIGVVVRTDIVGALTLTIRPPVIAGLATPLGVFLTTGHVRAGVGDFGLILSGVSMALMMLLSRLLIIAIAWAVQNTTSLPLLAIMQSPPASSAYWMDILKYVLDIAAFPLFLIMMRLSPLSGYHAAEHQVVSAIENGEPLRPEYVSHMPRVHPRCGTNIMAAVVLFLLVADTLGYEIAVIISIFILVFTWRQAGGYLQYFATTKTPSEKQLQSGIRAGEELLAQYRKYPGYRVDGFKRIMNIGMLQVMLGFILVMPITYLLNIVFPGFF